MIHVCTVHWKSPEWIEPQLRFLGRYLGKGEYQVHGLFHEIDPALVRNFDTAAFDSLPDHAVKLNRLAEFVSANAYDEDVLIFLDGDAFPIGPLKPALQRLLAEAPLVAVQRHENGGDIQPHPCFCATTVGFWRKLRGDWRAGPTWINSKGHPVTDVGGTLLKQLADSGVSWKRLTKTNVAVHHPVFYTVYGGLVYHHGAGFRRKVTRADLAALADTTNPIDRDQIHLRNTTVSREIRSLIDSNESDFFRAIGHISDGE